METPRMALAPSLSLLAVPSRAHIRLSRAAWSEASAPFSADSISLTLATARSTPLPPYRFLSPSRSSIASRLPVDAPEGTAARPKLPSERRTSTSTVGLPRESRICRAWIEVIVIIEWDPFITFEEARWPRFPSVNVRCEQDQFEPLRRRMPGIRERVQAPVRPKRRYFSRGP